LRTPRLLDRLSPRKSFLASVSKPGFFLSSGGQNSFAIYGIIVIELLSRELLLILGRWIPL
jgi:hypothetical protein